MIGFFVDQSGDWVFWFSSLLVDQSPEWLTRSVDQSPECICIGFYFVCLTNSQIAEILRYK
jgi:hypothetical protein